MKKTNFCIFFFLFIMLFTLSSCENNYSTPEKLKKDFIVDFNEKYSTDKDEDHFVCVGKYGNGYLVVRFIRYLYDMNDLPETITINNIDIICWKTTCFYYYYDHGIVEGLEEIYNQGYLSNDDLNDIKNKFAAWKDDYYKIGEDYPIA